MHKQKDILFVLFLFIPVISFTTPITPVIIIPGVVSSILQAKLTNATNLPTKCETTTKDFYPLWVSSSQILSQFNCFASNMAVNYNSTTQCAVSQPGVDIQAVNFGLTSCCDVLNPTDWFTIPKVVIWKPLSDYLRKNGYVDGTTLKAAPYDFRLFGDDCFNEIYFVKLKQMVEESYAPFHRKVALVSHSMGGNVGHQFLVRQTIDWKKKYINRFVAIAPPFSGAPEGIREFITGNLYNWIPNIIGKPLSQAFRSWPATISLFPQETSSLGGIRAWDNVTIVQTPSKNYTGTNGGLVIVELLNKLATSDPNSTRAKETKLGSIFWKNQQKMRDNVRNKGPGVITNCLYLTDVDTVVGTVFADDKLLKQISVNYGPGDGTVAAISTSASCETWRLHGNNNGMNVTCEPYHLGKYVNHHGVLGAIEILTRLLQLLQEVEV